jgi:hypothetical protein
MAVRDVGAGDTPDRDRHRRVAGNDVDVPGGDQLGQGERVMRYPRLETWVSGSG